MFGRAAVTGSWMILGFAVLLMISESVCACATKDSAVTCRQSGSWWIAESAHFSVWSKASALHAVEIVRHSEMLREELQKSWSINELPQWRCRCHVVIHPDLAAYQRTIPGERAPSVGYTTITIDHGEVIFRRIDLRSDAADWMQNALPHEMTHVILADLFPRERVPDWLNEGLAMLSEQPSLRARRDQVLAAALAEERVPSLRALLQHDLAGDQISPDLAYAVNLSVVSFLEGIGGRQRLGELAQSLTDSDCETALREVFKFKGGIDELDRRWRSEIGSQFKMATDDDSTSSSLVRTRPRGLNENADRLPSETGPQPYGSLLGG
jgi:hypothetical protein